MHRNEADIEDAVFDVVDEGPEVPKQLHPQFALWLARGFICSIIGAGALLFKPSLNAQPPAEANVTARSAATFVSVKAEAAEPVVIAASLSSETSRAVKTAVLVPSAPLRPSVPISRDAPQPPAATEPAEGTADVSKVRTGVETFSRPQRPHRRSASSSRATPRPLSIIARGAKRTVRSVRLVFAKLF